MLRFGNITEVDPVTGYARVTFLDDGIVSAPLQVLVRAAIQDKDTFTFNINEQVAVLMDENSVEGVILGALFNDKTNPGSGSGAGIYRMKFSDDSFIEYNKNTHEYNINVQGKVNIISTGETHVEAETVSVEAQQVSVDADTVAVTAIAVSVDSNELEITSPIVNIEGVVTVSGSMTVSGAVAAASISAPSISGPGVSMSGGNMEATGEIKGATITDGTIDLAAHKHTGVQTGGGTSGPATP